MADDVGERLLHDAEGGEVDAGRQPVGQLVASDGPALAVQPLEAHVEARAARPLDERVEVVEARGGGEGGRVALAEHVEHRAQLAEGVAAGVA